MNEFEICKKTKFLREQDAIDHIKRYRKTAKSPVQLRHYICPRCKCWHLTSQEPKSEVLINNLKNEIEKLKDKIQLQASELTHLKNVIIKQKNIHISELQRDIKHLRKNR